MPQYTLAQSMRVFTFIWLGQLVSLLGSSLTGFALGVWVYQRTGSVTQYALISLFSLLPGLLIAPLAGVLVDRWDRRWLMVVSDAGAGLGSLIIALLLWLGQLQIWQIYFVVAISSMFSAFQWPAYAAVTTLLVPKQHLGRANGMVQFAEAVSRLIAPALAGILVVSINLQGVILLDSVTFVFAIATQILVRFPKIKTTIADEEKNKSLLEEAVDGWTYITTRPGLLALLIFFAIKNFLVGTVNVLITPLVLCFASTTVLGSVLSIGGSGMILGSCVMSFWGGSRQRIHAVLGFTLLGGLSIVMAGIKPAAPVFFAAAFTYFFGFPIVNSCDQAIWQSKVELAVQGRVFALRRMLTWGSLPLASLVAGPLADQVFEPLLVPGGLLAGNLGQIIGVGKGYGIALLFILMGILTLLTTVSFYLYPPLRLLETQLPDAIIDNYFKSISKKPN
jgi:MFS transporter, DHA3 family, macrolide efflux protein